MSMLDKLKAPPTIMEGLVAEQQSVLRMIPEDHDMVFVTVIDDRGSRLGIAKRTPSGWVFGLELERRWKQRGVNGRVVIGKSWKARQ